MGRIQPPPLLSFVRLVFVATGTMENVYLYACAKTPYGRRNEHYHFTRYILHTGIILDNIFTPSQDSKIAQFVELSRHDLTP